MFSSARDLGMIVPMLNVFYKSPTRWKIAWRQIHFYLMVWGIIFTIIQGLVVYYILPVEASGNRSTLLLMISAQSLFFDVPILIGSRYYQLKENPIFISIISILSGTVALLTQLYCIVYLRYGYMGWFYSTFFSTLLAASIYIVSIVKAGLVPLPIWRKRYFIPRLKVSLPMIPHNYSAYLLNASDRLVMDFYRTPTSNIGIYNIAYMWGNYMEILGNAVGMAVGPWYLKMYAEESKGAENNVKALTVLLQTLFILGSFIVALWTKELFTVFIHNESLQLGYNLAIIIIMSYSYRPMYWMVVSKLQFYEKTSELWKITFVGGALNLLLNFALIPFFDYKVAAVTTFFALIYIGFSGYFLQSFKNINSSNFRISNWILIIVGATILAYLLKDATFGSKLIITSVSSFLSLFFVLRQVKIMQVND